MAGTDTNRRRFDPSQRLISTTNSGGRIVYANPEFINISGYSKEELEGSPHNIVRHPDMPKAAFKDLWDTIKQGRPWMGMVKNRVKTGEHYWVDAYVTPIIEHGKMVGYQSVRIAPDEAHVDRAAAAYKRVNAGRRASALPPVAWRHKLLGVYGISSVIMLGLLLAAGADMGILLGALLTLTGGGAGVAYLASQWNTVVARARAIHENELAQLIYSGRNDEIGAVELALKAQKSHLNTVLTRIDQSSADLDELAKAAARAVSATDQAIHNQQTELGSVSSAVTEMSSAILEVSSNTTQTSTAAEEADRSVVDGHHSIEESLTATSQLANYIDEVTQLIRRLGEDGNAIGSVIDVINGIAEQTNLLALNAAIEAARAGEQGRGFAVVADEVRTLAQRTQDSTVEIKDIIRRIQDGTQECVSSMETAQDKAQHCVSYNQKAGSSYSTINEAVSEIRNMTLQVAAAVEEQSAVAEEVNHNIVNIQNQSEETAKASQLTAKTSEKLAENIHNTREMIRQFSD